MSGHNSFDFCFALALYCSQSLNIHISQHIYHRYNAMPYHSYHSKPSQKNHQNPAPSNSDSPKSPEFYPFPHPFRPLIRFDPSPTPTAPPQNLPHEPFRPSFHTPTRGGRPSPGTRASAARNRQRRQRRCARGRNSLDGNSCTCPRRKKKRKNQPDSFFPPPSLSPASYRPHSPTPPPKSRKQRGKKRKK